MPLMLIYIVILLSLMVLAFTSIAIVACIIGPVIIGALNGCARKMESAIRSLNSQLSHLVVPAQYLIEMDCSLESIAKYMDADPIRTRQRRVEEVRSNVIAVSTDTWGLDYAKASNGLFPRFLEVGRRPIAPHDLGLKSWDIINPVNAGCSEGRVIDHTIDSDIYMIVTGLRVVAPDTHKAISGARLSPSGKDMPYIPFGGSWDREGSTNFFRYNYDVPFVVAPNACLAADIFASREAFTSTRKHQPRR